MTHRLWVNNAAAKRPPSVCQRVSLGCTAGANGPSVNARGGPEPHTRHVSPFKKKNKPIIIQSISIQAMDAPLAYGNANGTFTSALVVGTLKLGYS